MIAIPSIVAKYLTGIVLFDPHELTRVRDGYLHCSCFINMAAERARKASLLLMLWNPMS